MSTLPTKIYQYCLVIPLTNEIWKLTRLPTKYADDALYFQIKPIYIIVLPKKTISSKAKVGLPTITT